ncbi:MAG: acetyl/propionyl/methylcrotonyl-CoA carboxylase subunit alpha [Alphaproteobacteria bacterium]|nr:acetyl/propionyl/methylcrotonyl-CoA carboxylase subunit alpha [Alphaproteobacteria bacterium]
MSFRSVLIANRGEIACRIARTARARGLRVIAVFSDADADALHVRAADDARRIGPAPVRESYLNVPAILAAAKESGAEAVHPGYGFLSENADFAEACAKAGLVFVGPPPAAIRAMGSKSEAKALMEKAGVPVVPGYHGAAQDGATFAREAGRIGYPVLVKASAGGGGRGMRIVRAAGELSAALEGAAREAAAAFGDGRLLIEKYLERPRHIEIQVFADSKGRAIYLGERECSIQRRHQKVVEEAPAPRMDAKTRARMGEAAVAAATSIGYVGAGTVEFIADASGAFYFMEMNTRLQVEHPVTEMVTGQDLVAWQFHVAAGGDLPLAQADVRLDGHAIEVRLYAEDPARGFLPSTGRLAHLRFPAEDGRHVRVDTGVGAGDEVQVHYDPMIAKLVVWDRDRAGAIARLDRALADCEIVGVANNVAFLSAIARHPAYAAGETDTGFIARHEAALRPASAGAPAEALAFAALRVLLDRAHEAAEAAKASADPHSPWHATDGWRLNDVGRHALTFLEGEARHAVGVVYERGGWRIAAGGREMAARAGAEAEGQIVATLDGARRAASVVRVGGEFHVFLAGSPYRLTLDDPLAQAAGLDAEAGHLRAPMPGKILKVMVAAGAVVARGSPLLVLEAMKMEHTIVAPADGTVTELRFAEGEQVPEGAELLVFEASS